MKQRSLSIHGVTAAVLLALLAGCTQTRVYRVTMRNETPDPITVGFIKDGPPRELAWASPEELSDIVPSRRPENWGRVIDPGHKVSAKVQGAFASETHAYLRAYRGAPTMDELLAMSRGTGERTDVLLLPQGINDFTITDNQGRITARLTHQ